MKEKMQCIAILAIILLAGCATSENKIFFYANIDFTVDVNLKAQITYGEVVVGGVSKIILNPATNEKKIQIFLYRNYYTTLAKEGTLLVLQGDEKKIDKIELQPKMNGESLILEGGYFETRLGTDPK